MQENAVLKIRSCRCHLSWCPRCFKVYGLPRVREILGGFRWDHARHLVLTVNPDLYEGGQDAWKSINGQRLLSDLIRNLKRTKKKELGRWVWFLEWHRNGFPHWHVIVEAGEPGSRGMIGQDMIHQYWPVGRIRESFFKTKNHWDRFSGYVSKHGYIEKNKKHQGRLPDWALRYGYRIRRFDGTHEKEGEEKMSKVRFHMKDGDWVKRADRMQEREWVKENGGRPYYLALEACGKRTNVEIEAYGDHGMYFQVPIPLKEFELRFGGRYDEGVGWVIQVDPGELKEFSKKYGLSQIVNFIEWVESKR